MGNQNDLFYNELSLFNGILCNFLSALILGISVYPARPSTVNKRVGGIGDRSHFLI